MKTNDVDHDGDDRGLSHDYDGPSRSQQRREALEVFDLACALVELSDARLAQMPLSDELRALVIESRRITSHIARKRQLQFLAKQMRRREEELPPIRARLEHDRGLERRVSAELHRLERERDALVAGGDDAIAELVARHPGVDRQQVRQLVRRAQAEAAANKPPAASRALFRMLRDIAAEADAATETNTAPDPDEER
jgi:ribosome-associated protein